MKFLNYLTEKYWGRIESRWTGASLEIFENPTKKEFKEAATREFGPDNYVRFIADPKTKKVYIWNANAIHADMVPEIYNKSYSDVIFKVLPGIATRKGGKWVVKSADEVRVSPYRYEWIKARNWSWADKYIDISSWVDKLYIAENNLEEKYAGMAVSTVNKNKTGEVFKNPSRKEYRDALEASLEGQHSIGSIRAFYDYKKDDIWIWRGDILHNTVLKKMPEIPNHSFKFILEPNKKRLFLYMDLNMSRISIERGMKAVEERVEKAKKKIAKFAPESKNWRFDSS